MSVAVVTLALGSAPEFALSHPTMAGYAARIGADFIRINHRKVRHANWFTKAKHGMMYEKYQIAEILGRYERVIYLDGDTLVLPDCPDLTKVVPKDELGAVYEDVGPLWWKRWEPLFSYQRRFGWLPRRPEGYFNAGVMVFSRKHMPLFDLEKCPTLGVRWAEQSALNYHANRLGMPIRSLGWKFNCMGCFPEFAAERLTGAHIVHYAGEFRRLMAEDHRAVFSH